LVKSELRQINAILFPKVQQRLIKKAFVAVATKRQALKRQVVSESCKSYLLHFFGFDDGETSHLLRPFLG
jgi:hypothetical protein